MFHIAGLASLVAGVSAGFTSILAPRFDPARTLRWFRDDQVDGGPHKDTVSFADATGAVDVDLSASTASTGSDDDTLSEIEDVVGSRFGDSVRGTDTNNDVRVRGGNDAVRGAAGADDVRGGGGKDRLRGGDGDDDLFGGRGRDGLFGGPGTDFCKGGRGRDRTVGCE